MDVVIRGIEAGEHEAFERAKGVGFAQPFDAERLEAASGLRELDRMLGAFDGDEIVGTALAYSFRVSVPGPAETLELPAAGVAGVTVLPTHRRRGLLTAMMRRLLDDAHERGEPLSLLWASEAPIYPRFGYGLATVGMRWEIARAATAFLPGVSSADRRVRLLRTDQDKLIATLAPVHDRVRRARPGMVDRSPGWWRRRLADPKGELLCVVAEADEGIEGYAVYRVAGNWGPLGPDYRQSVHETMATTTPAEIALWRYLFDVDLVTAVSASGRPPDDPLPWMLANPRGLQRSLGDNAWLRLVDLPAALAGRRYASELSVVVDVADPFCPWNAGRWWLEGGPDGAECRPTDREPDLVCGVAELGAAFLGGTPLDALRRAGRVVEPAPGAARAADRAFASDLAPWAVTWF